MTSAATPTVARVISGALLGYTGALIEVETDIRAGLPSLQIVGMGNKAIDEARQRVQSAIRNTGLQFPPQKTTVNLAPAELPKDGTHLDVPVALSILVASKQLLQTEVNDTLFAGELALDGSLRPIRGSLLLAELAEKHALKRIILPHQNAAQAQLATKLPVIGVASLTELYRVLKGATAGIVASSAGVATPPLASTPPMTARAPNTNAPSGTAPNTLYDSIVGHHRAKRALAIAAAGRHNLLFSGPPGTGKTLLARSLVELLPPLTRTEATEVTKLHNLADGDETVHTTPPFRSPHHSVTLSALIGGGLHPKPGDISLAHKGVLFLDEMPEFKRSTLEALRQPLEDNSVRLSRLYGHIHYPADILLVATMKPCPCGYLGSETKTCSCSAQQISSYKQRISGPLLDRIDLRLTISEQKLEHIFSSSKPKTLTSSQRLKVLSSVSAARKAQAVRYNRSGFYNSNATLAQAQVLFRISPEAKRIVMTAGSKMKLSARALLRLLRIARTIADLDASPSIEPPHIAEALQLRE